ncbi:MAG TPA: LuxR C-terminal-related transcriptional regulator [Balneolaceae bacterium]
MNIHIYHHRTIVSKALSHLLQNEGYEVFLDHKNGLLQTKPLLNGKSLLIVDIDSLPHMEPYQEASLRNSECNIALMGSLQQLNWLFKFSSNSIGFICKTDKSDHLYRCIEELENEKTFLSDKIIDFISKENLEQQKMLFEKNLVQPLTKTELKVMLEIGRGKTTKQIAEDWHRSHHTVNNHRKSVKKKFNSKDSFRLSLFCFKKLNAIETLVILTKNKKCVELLAKND